jgi:hypothetical protein
MSSNLWDWQLELTSGATQYLVHVTSLTQFTIPVEDTLYQPYESGF